MLEFDPGYKFKAIADTNISISLESVSPNSMKLSNRSFVTKSLGDKNVHEDRSYRILPSNGFVNYLSPQYVGYINI